MMKKIYRLTWIFIFLIFTGLAYSQGSDPGVELNQLKQEYRKLLKDRDNLLLQTKKLLKYKAGSRGLEDEIAIAENRNKALAEEKQKLLKDIDDLKGHVDSLQIEGGNLLNQIQELQNYIEKMNVEYKLVNQIKSKLKKAQGANERLVKNVQSLEEKIQRSEKDNLEAKVEAAKYRKSLEYEQDEIQRVSAELVRTNKKLDKQILATNKARNDIKRYARSAEDAKIAAKRIESQINAYKKQLKEQKIIAKKAGLNVERYRKIAENKRIEEERLKAAQESGKKELEAQKQELARIEEDHQRDLKAAREDLQKDLDTKRLESEEALQAQRLKSKADVEIYARQYKELRKKYQQALEVNKKIERKLGEIPKKFIEIARENKLLLKETALMHYNLGVFYTQEKQYKRAIAEFEKALELKPEDAYAYFNLGYIYAEYLVNRPRAIKYFRLYLKLATKEDKDADWVKRYILTWQAWDANTPIK